MGNISSANFKKSKDFQVWHNADIRPSYAIGGGLEVNRNGAEALELKNQIIKQAIDTYNRTKKPKAPPFKAKSYEWSLVVNLKKSSTMADLEKLSAHFKDKYGFQCYQIAIHRDEGHIDELGNKQINHHAHLEFVTLDERTGKNRFRGEVVTAKGLRAVQDEVAQILQMERGADKRLSGAKRIEPRAYAVMKEREKAERKADLEKVERKKIIPLEIQLDWFQNENKKLEQKIKLNADINELEQKKQKLKAELEQIEAKYREKREEFKRRKNATQRAYSRLKKIFEYHKAEIKTRIAELVKEKQQEPQAPQTATPDDIEAKTRLINEAIAKTNQKDNQTEFLKPNMPKIDFDDDTQPNYHKKR